MKKHSIMEGWCPSFSKASYLGTYKCEDALSVNLNLFCFFKNCALVFVPRAHTHTHTQLHLVESTKLFQEPENMAAEVAKFAGLGDNHTFFEFAVDREASCDPRRRSSTVAAAYSKRKEAEPQLRKWYADHNDMMSELLGKETGWNDRIRAVYNNNNQL